MSRHGIEGVRCPQCGQDEIMWVVGLAWFPTHDRQRGCRAASKYSAWPFVKYVLSSKSLAS